MDFSFLLPSRPAPIYADLGYQIMTRDEAVAALKLIPDAVIETVNEAGEEGELV